MTVEFDSNDDLIAYLHSDAHETFVQQTWRPVIAQQAITSTSTPSGHRPDPKRRHS